MKYDLLYEKGIEIKFDDNVLYHVYPDGKVETFVIDERESMMIFTQKILAFYDKLLEFYSDDTNN